MSETNGRKCPDCGCDRLVRDGSAGEVVCVNCGIVVDEVEYAQGHAPKPNRGSFAAMGQLGSGKLGYIEVLRYGGERYLRMLGRDSERTVISMATQIATIANRIGAPKAVEEEASLWARRILKAMRTKGRKMSVDEIAAVSLWTACKLHSFPITMDEYVKALGWSGGNNGNSGGNGSKSLLKVINKAEGIMALPKVAPDPKRYIAKLAARLEEAGHNPRYIATVEAYARMLCDAAADDVSGKDPVCVASTALCVADEVMGGVIGREQIVRLAGAGYSSSAAEAMKRKKPPPTELLWSVFKFAHGKRVAKALVQSRLQPPSHGARAV
ncbi:MAG: hypothetical protein RMJ15_04130 [Nitrososphaerota archaeon]|nr:hypothetical protein [Candidatus Bathyarchaeota archaeon]MDW8022911.1 hypothetical protein [Nitrososphaerota archaeon]